MATPKPPPAVQTAAPVQGLHAVNVTDEDKPVDTAQLDKAHEAPEHTHPDPVSPAVPETDAQAVVAATPAAGSAPVMPAPPAPPAPAVPEAVAAPTETASPPLVPAPVPANAPAMTEAASTPPSGAKPDNAAATAPAPLAISPTTEAPPWLAQARFVWPASTQFIYDVIGESKGIRFHADGDMLWRHDGKNYEMRLEIRHFLLGSKTQTSVGQLSAQGLQPKRFGDKYKQEVAAHFDRDKGQLIFSASSSPQPLLPAAQDRLSLFAQLPALLAGTPELRQSGQQISFQVVAAKSADIWTFQVDKQETLQLPIGPVSAWKLSRVFKGTYDQTADVWLSPAYGYLPVKVRIAQSNGDVLEQNLSKVQVP